MGDPREMLGQLLGGAYRVEQHLTSGGMGEIYAARDTRSGRQCAVKLLSEETALDQGCVQRFRHEARVTASLESSAVVKVLASELDRRPFFIAMELLRGEDLAQVLAREPQLPSARGLAVVLSICRAVATIHRQGVVHGDLKPANVFLVDGAASDEVKLLDLGLARVQGATAPEPWQRERRGTPRYAAPEQLAPEGDKIGPWTDVFALGSIAYEVLAGWAPFSAGSTAATLEKIRRHTPPPLDEVGGHTPRAVAEVVARALAKEPARRYATAAELCRALEAAGAAEAGEQTLEPSHARGGEAGPPVAAGVRRGGAWIAALVLAVLAGAIVFVANGWRGERSAGRRDARTAAAKLPRRDSWRPPPREAAAVSIDDAARDPFAASVKIGFRGTPRGARVVDITTGRVLLRVPGAIELPRSSRGTLSWRVVRAGYHPQLIAITPDRDRTIEVRLRRRVH